MFLGFMSITHAAIALIKWSLRGFFNYHSIAVAVRLGGDSVCGFVWVVSVTVVR
jgi:hypothetical protein